MSNRFYFGDDSSSASSTDLDSLPYPKPLTPASFLTPDFDPSTFLASLDTRFQTLEDLRSELRQRSVDLNKELLDLVNSNYEDFLSLGRDLKGGDEKVEEIRLGVMGFKREIEGMRDKVRERREEVEGLVKRKKEVRRQIVIGRGMLDVHGKIEELEGKLMLVQNGVKEIGSDGGESEAESEDELDDEFGVWKLRRHAEQYVLIMRLIQKLGPELPFLVAQEERVQRLQRTILLDLDGALKRAVSGGKSNSASTLQILDIFKSLSQPQAAIKILKELKFKKP